MKSKLDARLLVMVEDLENAAARERAGAAAARGDATCIDATIDVTVYYTGALDDLVAAGLELAWHGRNERMSYALGAVAPTRITAIAAIPHVVGIEAHGKPTPELSDSVPAIHVTALRQAHPDAIGTGVFVAIIDEGFDWKHGGFRDGTTGKTRIEAIWDFPAAIGGRQPGEVGFQALDLDTPDPNNRHPESGVYYQRDDIDHSLGFQVTKQNPVTVRTSDPPGVFDPKKPDEPYGHGTHVAGIAAGDGSPKPCCRPWGSGRFKGVAPGADLILVRGGPGDSQLPLALSFIDEIAGARPVVVNVSMGDNSGPHDGASIAEKAIDKFVAKPGRVFVKSAGNEGNTKKHSRVTVPAQAGAPPVPGTATLEVVIPAKMTDNDTMEVWYSQAASLELQFGVDNRTSAWLAQQGNIGFELDTGGSPPRIIAVAIANWQGNNDRKIQIVVPKNPGDSAITFTMRFRNAGATPVVVDSWIAKGRNGPTFSSPTVECTLSTPGTALGAITVANHTLGSSTCDTDAAIHETSSRGPIRVVPADPAAAAAAAKPTLAAPGTGITSAKPDGGCCLCPEWLENHYQTLSGTSMAAPHVAGVIALMLQKNPTLTAVQVRDLFKQHATTVNGPAIEWGAGKLDALAVWNSVPAPAPPPSPPAQPLVAFAPSPGAPAVAFARMAPAAAPPAAPAQPLPTSTLNPAMRVLRDNVRRVPDGELAAALISRHFSEVRRLINNNAKVATMWHRADGPRMLRRLALGSVERHAPAPLRGDEDRDYLVRLFEQLHRHGSPALKASIDRHQALLLRLVATPLAAQVATT